MHLKRHTCEWLSSAPCNTVCVWLCMSSEQNFCNFSTSFMELLILTELDTFVFLAASGRGVGQVLIWFCRWTQQQTPAGPGRVTPEKSPGSSPNAETTFKSALSDPGAKTSITITGRSPSKLSRAAANSPPGAGANDLAEASANGDAGAGADGHSGAASRGPETTQSLHGLVTAVEDDQEIQNIRAIMRRQPFRHKTQLEYYALPAGIKVIIHPCICSFVHLFNCLFI